MNIILSTSNDIDFDIFLELHTHYKKLNMSTMISGMKYGTVLIKLSQTLKFCSKFCLFV